MDFVAEEYRAAPLSDEKARKCHPGVSYRTLGRRKCTEVLPKRVVLHPRVTKMLGSVIQACRTLLSGDENVRKCCLSVPRYTLGRRIVWVSLPRSPIPPYVILPYTLGRRKCATVLPKRAALHPRATKMRDSVAQACCAVPSGDENARQCCPSVSCCTLGRRKCSEVSPKRAVSHSRVTILG